MLAAAQATCFLIADISGYTGYLADVAALRPNFRLAKRPVCSRC